jgi:two-component system NtrC family sensor kinase
VRGQRILIISHDSELGQTLRALLPSDAEVEVLSALTALGTPISPTHPTSLALVDVTLLSGRPLNLLELAPLQAMPVLLILPESLPHTALNPLLAQLHVLGVLVPPYTTDTNRAALDAAIRNAPLHLQKADLEQQLAAAQQRLDQRLQEINVIYSIGKSVAASMGIDEALPRIVTTAVNLTRAEEGFIILQEEGQLYLRASHRFNEPDAVPQRTLARDPVAQRVIQSGRPVMLKRETRLATGNLVQALLYLPILRPGGSTLGVLGVVNRERTAEFTEAQLFALSAIADYAAVAMENARLFGEIRREQHRLHSIVEQATEAVLITDEHDHLLFWSRTAANVFSVPEDAVGKPFLEVLQHAQLLELFHQAIEEPDSPQGEIVLPGGRVMNAQITSVPELGRVVVMQDITKLKELDRIKTEFVQTVSHDLRTPLTTIQGYVMLLERAGSLNEMQRAFVRKALDSLADITDLITDLLDLGRIEAEYEMPMQDLQLQQVLKEVQAQHQNQARDLDISLEIKLPEAPLQVRGNAYRLQQALGKIVDNAIKYNRPHGQVKIDTEDTGEHIIVRVKDDGFGIPLADQAHIFERFYRVILPETESIRGTGLGLAIVKSIIERHRGRIWVESAMGEGSCFTLLLPKNN